MAGRGRPRAVPQTAKREQYAALIERGVSFSEACRIVGIARLIDPDRSRPQTTMPPARGEWMTGSRTPACPRQRSEPW
jgi:hypothetical protein